MNQQIEKFYAYLQELNQNYGKLGDLLQRKMAAVAGLDMAELDKIIKEEQVYVLLSKGFDTNLLSHREKLGLESETLSEIIEELPQEHRESFRQLHKRLRNTLDEADVLNKKCQEMIEDRLYTLDKSIKAMDQAENGTYRKDGDAKVPPEGKPSLFTKSI